MKSEWKITGINKESSENLAKNTGCNLITAGILSNRGIDSTIDAGHFLNPSLTNLNSPFILKDMEKAVSRITKALHENQKILIFGDYDVDGVTATTILLNFLNYTGADVSYYIPHRVKEGYSFHASHVKKILKPQKIDLVITVDCGSDSHDAVKEAVEANIDVIITDHHTIPALPPEAVAVVNPKRQDCTSGLSHLAGVGVAFYLLIALRKHLRDIGFWKTLKEPNLKSYCDLTALGTIGDIVPLVGVNRIITKTGLDILNTAPCTGLHAMITAGKINKQIIDSTDVAFKIAPRINAAGRLNHAGIAVDLLCETKPIEAKKTALILNDYNSQRQGLEQDILEEIEAHIAETPSILDKKSIILFKQGWHIGILGIVASKLVNTYHRPVILIALDGATGKGSGRSIQGADLYELLNDSSNLLEGFGGHAMAAGLSIKTDNLRPFIESFNSSVNRQLTGTDLKKEIKIECNILFDDITPSLLDELERLQPFGAGNPEPLFIMDNISIVSSSVVGKNHRRLILKSSESGNDNRILAMHFNTDTTTPYPDYFKHLVFKLQWNYWNNSKSLQIIVHDFS